MYKTLAGTGMHSMKRVVVTGASGFVGRALLSKLLATPGLQPVAAQRGPALIIPGRTHETVRVADLSGDTDWTAALTGADAVIHAAGRAHIMREPSPESALDAYRVANVAATASLARQSAAMKVRRFIFISSIKVNGESTDDRPPFTASDTPRPSDPYSQSKWEAEQELGLISKVTGMEIVIIRPPLVYGPGVKANFRRMMRYVHRGIPLPLGAVRNKRSLVALDNLVDLLATCVDHPNAAGRTFLVSDGESLSTPELLNRLGDALGKRALLIPVPQRLLKIGGLIFGRREFTKRLCSSLEIDMTAARSDLGWSPPVSSIVALTLTAEHFLAGERD
jgi:UDP-glucose 4-epimerase